MIHLLILVVHLLATIAKLLRPGGVRAVVAESLLLKHQLVISSRALRRAPNLNSFDRFVRYCAMPCNSKRNRASTSGVGTRTVKKLKRPKDLGKRAAAGRSRTL